MTMAIEELLTYEEAGKILRMSHSQVRRWLYSHNIPFVAISERKRMIRKSDLENYIQNNIVRVKPLEPATT